MNLELILFLIVVLLLLFVIVLQQRATTETNLRYVEHGAKQLKQYQDGLDQWAAERQAWTIERQQLLDRIQAPSFAEFKQAEIKTSKLQLGVKDPPPLEPL